MAGLFVSQVGNQPGAVAVAAQALIRGGAVDQVFLLYSPASDKGPGTEGLCANLAACFDRSFPGVAVKQFPVNQRGDAAEWFGKVIQNLVENQELQVFLNTSSGYSFFWGALSRRFRGVSRVVPVFSEFKWLSTAGGGQTWPLEDLGLPTLIEMHGLKGSWTPSDFPGVVSDLCLSAPEKVGVYRASWAYEKNGRLYGLHENLGHLDKTRKLLSWNKGEPLLAGLQPQMTGVCSDYFSWLRLKASGLNAFLLPEGDGDQKRRADSQVAHWKKRELSLPGRTAPTKNFTSPPGEPVAGAGGDGPPLLVCLGNDPSATLVAIYAQRPERAWIFYDRKTPIVVCLAANLAACAQQLPVGEVTFLATDVNGGDIVAAASRVRAGLAEPLVANVTPGSKAQSWVFGQLEGVRLVSIDKRRGGVSSLDGEEPALFFALAPVASEVLGKTLGGPGLRSRLGMAEIAAREEFLREMAHCLKALAKPDKPLSFGRKSLTLVAPKERIKLTSCWAEDVLQVQISRQGKLLAGEFSAPLVKGTVKADWLEDVVAGAFFAAGAKDILVGAEWPWLNGKQKKKDKHRTEIDVVFPWGPHQVAVSVKASSLAGGKNVPAECDEIRAMAVECLGRLSLPVLVYHAPPQKASRSHALATMKKWGVLVIADTLLCNPAGLKSLLDEAFASLMKGG